MMDREFFGRSGLLGVFAVFATIKVGALLQHFQKAQEYDSEFYLKSAAGLASLAFIFLIMLTTLSRLRPERSAKGLEPRVSALVGAFLGLSLGLIPPVDLAPGWRLAALFLSASGLILSFWVLLWLGRSFSVTAQARKLVTTGRYSLVRHPLYVTEGVTVLGMVLNALSPLALLLGSVQIGFQFRRILNEERVLREFFPEYASYSSTTPRLIPRIWPWRHIDRPARL